MSNNVKLQLLLRAVDQASRPFKSIRTASKSLSGDKRVIDEQDWTITKVTHFLNNSGFTTSLELEVRLSDVEYETEDDE